MYLAPSSCQFHKTPMDDESNARSHGLPHRAAVPFTPSNGICTPTPTGAPIHQPPWQADMGAHMPPGWAVPPPFAPPPPYPGGVYPFQAGGPLHAGVFPPVVFVPPPPPPPVRPHPPIFSSCRSLHPMHSAS